MTTSPNFNENVILNVAQVAARASAEILLRYFGTAEVHEKSSQNLVTQADIESEEIITSIIQKEFPSHLILREEGQSTGNASAAQLWVIDPLDATNNYAHGIPHFSVSIAYAEHGNVEVGVVLDPVRNEMFLATRDGGAFLNDRPIKVSERAALTETIIATGFYYDRGAVMERTLNAIRNLFQKNIRGIRRTGGAALDLAWVACGRFDGFFEYKLAPWDYAAGSLIVQEAGGRCCDCQGHPLSVGSGHIIAANGRVFDEFRMTVIQS